MLHQYFAIFDKRAGKHHPVFPAPDAVVAERMVIAAMKPDTMLYNYPEDYELRHICTYDDDTGTVESVTLRHVKNLTDIKRPKPTSMDQALADQLAEQAHEEWARETEKEANNG